jgi:hypothetical protein
MRRLIATVVCAAVMALSSALPASAEAPHNALSLNGLSVMAGFHASQVVGIELPKR